MFGQAIDWLVFSVLPLAPESHLGESVRFFIYDSIEILLLLGVVTFFMSLLRHYLPVEKIRDFLARHKFFGLDYFLATIFGAVTPFCTCSSIPLFIGFLGAGIPLGVTFAFLITSPLVNEIAVALLIGLFGWKVTALYVASGLLVGMAGGAVISRLKMERYVDGLVAAAPNPASAAAPAPFSRAVLKTVSLDAWKIIKQVTPYLLLGVAVGALIHGYVPQDFFERHVGQDNILAVPLAVALGVPFYSNAHSVIPIIQPLVDKGVPLGTALAFMMATVGLSLPEALILKKVIRLPLLLTFFGVVSLGIVVIGYLLNLV